MDKSNKIENLANKYVERHIRDRHLSDDTIKEISWEEAECFIKQRASTEKAVGFIPKD